MRKTTDEIIASVKSFVGDEPTDEGIALLEDIADSMDTSGSDAVIAEKDARISELETALSESRARYVARFGSNEATAETAEQTSEVDNGDNVETETEIPTIEQIAESMM